MSLTKYTGLLPAAFLALAFALVLSPAQAHETAMETGADAQTADVPVDDPHRHGD